MVGEGWLAQAYLGGKGVKNFADLSKKAIAAAADAATQAAQLRPRDMGYAFTAGALASQAGRLNAARLYFDSLLTSDPGSPYAERSHQLLAEVYDKLGNPAAARQHRTAARQLGLLRQRK